MNLGKCRVSVRNKFDSKKSRFWADKSGYFGSLQRGMELKYGSGMPKYQLSRTAGQSELHYHSFILPYFAANLDNCHAGLHFIRPILSQNSPTLPENSLGLQLNSPASEQVSRVKGQSRLSRCSGQSVLEDLKPDLEDFKATFGNIFFII